jgi:hypothetical protein
VAASIITVSDRTFDAENSPLKLLGWLCERHGFGTYLHLIRGVLDQSSHQERRRLRGALIRMVAEFPGVFVDTVVSPSYRTALAQALQIPGVSGMENNTVLFSFVADNDPELAASVADEALFASITKKNLLILRQTGLDFGARLEIHIWLNWNDTDNATLMTLLAYILVGHKDWRRSQISVFAAFPGAEVDDRRTRLEAMMEGGRLPIRKENVNFFSVDDTAQYHALVETSSADADLVILGLTIDRLSDKRAESLLRYPRLGDVLFVAAADEVRIT